MLLSIESRIGEIAAKEERAATVPIRGIGNGRQGSKPSGKPPKHERLGMDIKQKKTKQTGENK
jgi:hypothetical protein